MRKLVVYQLLGQIKYSPVLFRVERSDRTYRSRFSSYAIAHHLTSSGHYDECEIRFLAPISLLRPEECTESWLDLERFKDRVRSELKDVEPDVTWKSEVVPLPAFGRYKIDSEIWEFASSPDSVAAAALVDMISSSGVLRERGRRLSVVLNVSTGHNSYIPPLVEALKALVVIDGALSVGREAVIEESKYATTDPVLYGMDVEHIVYLRDSPARFFLDYPFKDRDSIDGACNLRWLLRDRDDGALNDVSDVADALLYRIRCLLIEGLKAFNAFRYGAPLALLDRRLVRLDPQEALRCAEDLLDLIVAVLKPNLSGNIVSIPDIDFAHFRSLLIALALCASIPLAVSSLGITNSQENGVAVDDLGKFAQLYEERLPELKLNSRILQRELNDINSYLPGMGAEWQTLKAVQESRRTIRRGTPYLSDQKRNFYAHAGLSKNEAEVRAAAGRVFLRYSEKRLKEIESWLMKPW